MILQNYTHLLMKNYVNICLYLFTHPILPINKKREGWTLSLPVGHRRPVVGDKAALLGGSGRTQNRAANGERASSRGRT